MVLSIVAAMFLSQATLAAAPEAPPAAQTPAATSTVSPVEVTGEKAISKKREVNLAEITCHEELPPGTRFKVRVCATNRQFQERTREQQQLVTDWQKSSITSRQQ